MADTDDASVDDGGVDDVQHSGVRGHQVHHPQNHEQRPLPPPPPPTQKQQEQLVQPKPKHEHKHKQQTEQEQNRPRRQQWLRRPFQRISRQRQQQCGGRTNDPMAIPEPNERWYFCVGPLVHPDVRARRLLSSTDSHQAAVLLDYKLVFSHAGVDCVPKVGYNVQGVVMRVPCDDDWNRIVDADSAAFSRVLVNVYPYNTTTNTATSTTTTTTTSTKTNATTNSSRFCSYGSKNNRIIHDGQDGDTLDLSTSTTYNRDFPSSLGCETDDDNDDYHYNDIQNHNEHDDDEEGDEHVDIALIACKNRPILAYVSVMNEYDESKVINENAPIEKKPQERYLRLVSEGMKFHGVDETYVADEIMSCPYIPKRTQDNWCRFPTTAPPPPAAAAAKKRSSFLFQKWQLLSSEHRHPQHPQHLQNCQIEDESYSNENDSSSISTRNTESQMHRRQQQNDQDQQMRLPVLTMKKYKRLCAKNSTPHSDLYFILHNHVLKMDNHDPQSPVAGWVRMKGHGKPDLSYTIHQIVVDPDIPWAKTRDDMTLLHYDWAEDHLQEALKLSGLTATKVYRLKR